MNTSKKVEYKVYKKKKVVNTESFKVTNAWHAISKSMNTVKGGRLGATRNEIRRRIWNWIVVDLRHLHKESEICL